MVKYTLEEIRNRNRSIKSRLTNTNHGNGDARLKILEKNKQSPHKVTKHKLNVKNDNTPKNLVITTPNDLKQAREQRFSTVITRFIF